MPTIKHYEVTQTRSIPVAAVNVTEAMLIANREFAKSSPNEEIIPDTEIQGYPTGPVEVATTDIRKEF